MADFNSALYLGLQHAWRDLQPWSALTSGRPAALREVAGAQAVAGELARLVGCGGAVLGSSTLHLFFDLFEVLAPARIGICLEAGAYPVARWGAERAAGLGIPLLTFRTGDPAGLARSLAALRRSGRRPVVVADGLNPASGRPAPLAALLPAVQAHRGWLVIDDTQALGILGARSVPGHPYGLGGGGTAAWHGIRAPELVVVASLAKGLGVPLAVLAGNAELVGRYKRASLTRVHCSGPSAAHVAAAAHALALNRSRGDGLRHRLVVNVASFRSRLAARGIGSMGGWFPVQTPVLDDAAAVHAALQAQGVHGVLHSGAAGQPSRLSFLLTAAHSAREIDLLAAAIGRLAWQGGSRSLSQGKHHEAFADFQA